VQVIRPLNQFLNPTAKKFSQAVYKHALSDWKLNGFQALLLKQSEAAGRHSDRFISKFNLIRNFSHG